MGNRGCQRPFLLSQARDQSFRFPGLRGKPPAMLGHVPGADGELRLQRRLFRDQAIEPPAFPAQVVEAPEGDRAR